MSCIFSYSFGFIVQFDFVYLLFHIGSTHRSSVLLSMTLASSVNHNKTV
jgi:hypothetical protein